MTGNHDREPQPPSAERPDGGVSERKPKSPEELGEFAEQMLTFLDEETESARRQVDDAFASAPERIGIPAETAQRIGEETGLAAAHAEAAAVLDAATVVAQDDIRSAAAPPEAATDTAGTAAESYAEQVRGWIEELRAFDPIKVAAEVVQRESELADPDAREAYRRPERERLSRMRTASESRRQELAASLRERVAAYVEERWPVGIDAKHWEGTQESVADAATIASLERKTEIIQDPFLAVRMVEFACRTEGGAGPIGFKPADRDGMARALLPGRVQPLQARDGSRAYGPELEGDAARAYHKERNRLLDLFREDTRTPNRYAVILDASHQWLDGLAAVEKTQREEGTSFAGKFSALEEEIARLERLRRAS